MSSVDTATKSPGARKKVAALEKVEQTTSAAAHTVGAADIHANYTHTGGSPHTVTLPADVDDATILIGHYGWITQGSASLVTVAAGSGATAHFGNATGKLTQAWARVRWEKVAANTYMVNGDLAAS